MAYLINGSRDTVPVVLSIFERNSLANECRLSSNLIHGPGIRRRRLGITFEPSVRYV